MVIQTPPELFGMTTSGLKYREIERWIRPAAEYRFRVASASFAIMGLMRCSRDVAGAPPFGTEISKGIQGAGGKPRLDLGENV